MNRGFGGLVQATVAVVLGSQPFLVGDGFVALRGNAVALADEIGQALVEEVVICLADDVFFGCPIQFFHAWIAELVNPIHVF